MGAINQNMKSETIIAWRFMKDHMIVNGLTPQSIYTDSPSIESVETNVSKSNKRKTKKMRLEYNKKPYLQIC